MWMLKICIDLLALRYSRASFGIGILKIATRFRNSVRRSNAISFDYERLREVNSLPISKNSTQLQEARALFVVTQKDFRTLPLAISSLIASTGISQTEIDVVTPDIFLFDCSELLKSEGLEAVNILDEGQIIPLMDLNSLKNRSGERFGWILQQLLKLQVSINSSAKFTLICDADTILLRPREWTRGNQIVLFPSMEINQEYYNFLNRAFGFSSNPRYSFVSHHMLVNNFALRSIFKDLRIDSITKVIEIINNFADFESASSVSIDYEFYAQYMFVNHRGSIFLEKWSNIGIPAKFFKFFKNSHLFRKILGFNYQSVSFHSWS